MVGLWESKSATVPDRSWIRIQHTSQSFTRVRRIRRWYVSLDFSSWNYLLKIQAPHSICYQLLQGGIAVESLIKIGKKIDFGTLYIKPAFVFQDDDGSIKLQFEADANSALGYLYSSLCQMLGITWNNDSPYNDLGLYTNCAMHAASDR